MMYVFEKKRKKAITGGVNAHGDSAEHARKRSKRAQFISLHGYRTAMREHAVLHPLERAPHADAWVRQEKTG
jgi:hypothetical protein